MHSTAWLYATMRINRAQLFKRVGNSGNKTQYRKCWCVVGNHTATALETVSERRIIRGGAYNRQVQVIHTVVVLYALLVGRGRGYFRRRGEHAIEAVRTDYTHYKARQYICTMYFSNDTNIFSATNLSFCIHNLVFYRCRVDYLHYNA